MLPFRPLHYRAIFATFMCSFRLDFPLVGAAGGHPDVRLHCVGVRRRWIYQGALGGVGDTSHRTIGALRTRISSSRRLGAGQHETALKVPAYQATRIRTA